MASEPTNQEILEKAITKAIEGGFNPEPYFKSKDVYVPAIVDNPLQYGLIYNHDFAKALWGEQKALENGEYPSEVIMYEGKPIWHPWQYHLQQMVIADDPIAYLGEHI